MSWTPAQHRLFEAAAHDPEIAKRKGIKQVDAQRMADEGVKTAKKPTTLRADIEKAVKRQEGKEE